MNWTIILTSYGIIKISGVDALKFMQGQFTYDVSTIIPQGNLCAHCNPKGRVISLFYIATYADEYFLILPRSLLTIAIKALKKYSLFFKCAITDESAALECVGEFIEEDKTIAVSSLCTVTIDSKRRILVRKKTCIAQIDTNKEKMWCLQNIYQHLPMIFPETSEKFLPHEINLPQLNAISFNKGCFTGQEIIARMHYRSKIIKLLKVAKFPNTINVQRGADIYCQDHDSIKACGGIIDICDDSIFCYALITCDEKDDHKNLYLDAERKINLIQSELNNG